MLKWDKKSFFFGVGIILGIVTTQVYAAVENTPYGKYNIKAIAKIPSPKPTKTAPLGYMHQVVVDTMNPPMAIYILSNKSQSEITQQIASGNLQCEKFSAESEAETRQMWKSPNFVSMVSGIALEKSGAIPPHLAKNPNFKVAMDVAKLQLEFANLAAEKPMYACTIF